MRSSQKQITRYDIVPYYAQWFYTKKRSRLRPGEKKDTSPWAKKNAYFLIACGWL